MLRLSPPVAPLVFPPLASPAALRWMSSLAAAAVVAALRGSWSDGMPPPLAPVRWLAEARASPAPEPLAVWPLLGSLSGPLRARQAPGRPALVAWR